jgi:polysaccharide export outer membrane protein
MKRVSTSAQRAAAAFLERTERATPGVKRPMSGCLLLLCSIALRGCTSPPRSFTVVAQSIASSPKIAGDEVLFPSDSQDTSEIDRLVRLWHSRIHGGPLGDYPIGPGDVLEISTPAMDELKDRVVRVSGEGTITLPLIGAVQAAGRTEAQVRETIRQALATYMHVPQFNLFVREYRSRQVAVVGAVSKPGLYNLASEADTILDVVALAGGMTEEAAQRILLIPAEPADNGTTTALAAILPPQLASLPPSFHSLKSLKQTEPLLIDLKHLTRGGHQIYLSLPVRPGDVIMVPGHGQVLVQGWVDKPGPYKITPGLTVLGAVAAAGGPLFAADTSSVHVIRTGKHGEKITYKADLERIKYGEKPDIPVLEADVIDVVSSAPKLVPYGVYRFFTSLLHLGATVPVR